MTPERKRRGRLSGHPDAKASLVRSPIESDDWADNQAQCARAGNRRNALVNFELIPVR